MNDGLKRVTCEVSRCLGVCLLYPVAEDCASDDCYDADAYKEACEQLTGLNNGSNVRDNASRPEYALA